MINEKCAKRFCKEDISNIENYEKAVSDSTQTWECHHRTEIWWNCTRKDLIDNECYYHRKACELIFLTHAEHTRLHNMHMSDATRKKISKSQKGKVLSEEHRQKIAESLKGCSSSMKGKHHSEETRRKMSEARKAYLAKR